MGIHISVNGLAKFMKSGPAKQRSLLRDFKFPFTKEGKRKPQIVRYSEARAAIRKYHSGGNDITVLVKAVEELTKKLFDPEKDQSRIKDNIRAIETYMKYFSGSTFAVLENPKPKYVHGDVEVSTTPDLFVEEKSVKKLIKLDFNSQQPDKDVVSIILKVMHEAAETDQLGVRAKDVIYLDVSRRAQYTGAKLNRRLKREVDAACETIQDIWPRLKQT